jgi:malate dehydrogenase (oxaloacetate-decarboxylating)
MGTDNLALLNDEMYLGERHARVRDSRYDTVIDAYVTAVTKLFPNAMLHWEDFGAGNARRILNRCADRCCTFNDDMQGTAAVVLAGMLAALKAAGTRLTDQRIVIHGAGTAGLGIADMVRDQMIREGLSCEEATRRFWPLDHDGLHTAHRAEKLYDFQQPYARATAEVAAWNGIGLAEVVTQVKPTILIGTSTQIGAFRGHRQGHGRSHRAAGHHADVQPHLPLRGPTRGPAELDRRPGADRHREPVRARHPRGHDLSHRPIQQRPRLSRPRPRRGRGPGEPDQRPDDRRRGRRGGRVV